MDESSKKRIDVHAFFLHVKAKIEEVGPLKKKGGIPPPSIDSVMSSKLLVRIPEAPDHFSTSSS